jgi:hypothetical protein
LRRHRRRGRHGERREDDPEGSPEADGGRTWHADLSFGTFYAVAATALPTCVDAARAALAAGDIPTAQSTLQALIDEVEALADSEETEAILRKAEAVHGTFD